MATDRQKLGIGAVSKATDIPSPTLRTWERRYDFPSPERNESGHRVYEPAVIEALRLAQRAIEAGHRASQVVGMPTDELRDLLKASRRSDAEQSRPRQPPEAEAGARGQPPSWMQRWLEAAAELDGRALERRLRDAWNRLGGLEFLKNRAAPFLNGVGDAWATGDLNVVHEHYASEVLRDFLTSQWRPLSDRSREPRVVCATLPEERHALGLHIAACVLTMSGWNLIFLGADTPLDDILEGSRISSVRAVAVSISQSTAGAESTRRLRELADRLPDKIDLLVGGGGANRLPDGVPQRAKDFESLDALYRWAFNRAN